MTKAASRRTECRLRVLEESVAGLGIQKCDMHVPPVAQVFRGEAPREFDVEIAMIPGRVRRLPHQPDMRYSVYKPEQFVLLHRRQLADVWPLHDHSGDLIVRDKCGHS